MRGVQKVTSQNETSSELPSIEKCKEQLLNIAQFYTQTSKPYDREWEEGEKARLWEETVRKVTTVNQITPLIIQLNEGMSLPTSLIKRDDRVQRFKLQFFKFWPNQDLKSAWLNYTQNIG